MPRLALAALLCLLAALPARGEDNPILARMAAFAAAYNAADAEAVAAFYTPDGALLPPRAAPRVGRAAIAAHYAAAFQAGVGNLRYEVKEIRAHGPTTAVEIGETLVSQGDATIHGRYLHVWTLTDGAWLLSRDIYHVLGTR